MATDRGEGFALPAVTFALTPIEQPAYRIGVLDQQGYNDGHAAGYAEGEADGYAAGYADGFADGVASAPQPDETPPTVTIVSPTPGVAPGQPGGFPRRRSDAIKTPIVLRVGDAAPGLAYVAITVRFYGSAAELAADRGGVEENVYRRGGFRGKHTNGSSVAVDGDDLVFTIKRDGGWVGRYMRFAVDPIDGAGNLA